MQTVSTHTLDIDSLESNLAAGSAWARTNGNRVRARRHAMGLSLSQVGMLVGKPPQTIHGIETGRIVPRDYLRLAIAHSLKRDLDELFPMPSREEVAEFMDVAA